MPSYFLNIFVFGGPLALLAGIYLLIQQRNHRQAVKKLAQAKIDGLTEPPTLHPEIDPAICIGCGTCVTACPEGKILGLVNRKAVLVSPTSCIGHGACREACPTGAIDLVFGTATRGVEIPLLSQEFETNVPGIFIAGELGGMGLIVNAITQGTQAIEAIMRQAGTSNTDAFDLIIVGAGPAGLSAALAAKERKLRFKVLEQDTIGGTVSHYPRGKIVMTRPATLPLVGKFQFKEAHKEVLMEFWESAAKEVAGDIITCCQVKSIENLGDKFSLTTGNETFTSRFVLLAMGRRGTPRKLDVPGEELSKVVYRLIDPEQYSNRHVLVVGGGDSALEAALAISEQRGTTTTLSYRNAAFSRAKPKNREAIAAAHTQGRIKVLMNSTVELIEPMQVIISSNNQKTALPNDEVVVCAGGVLATGFLKNIGIHVEEKFGAA